MDFGQLYSRGLFGLIANHPLRRVKETLRNTKKFGGNFETFTDEYNFDFLKMTLLNFCSQQISEILSSFIVKINCHKKLPGA